MCKAQHGLFSWNFFILHLTIRHHSTVRTQSIFHSQSSKLVVSFARAWVDSLLSSMTVLQAAKVPNSTIGLVAEHSLQSWVQVAALNGIECRMALRIVLNLCTVSRGPSNSVRRRLQGRAMASQGRTDCRNPTRIVSCWTARNAPLKCRRA